MSCERCGYTLECAVEKEEGQLSLLLLFFWMKQKSPRC